MFHMVHRIRPETLTTTPNQLQLTLSITACGSIQNTTLTSCITIRLSKRPHIAAALPASVVEDTQAVW